jgi:hypothetical protein
MTVLADWLKSRRDTVTWLDSDRYVWSVFAGRPDRWYDDPGLLVSSTAQAQKLLRSDVQGVNIVGPFERRLEPGADSAQVCEALESAESRRQLAEALDAFAHQFGDQVDLVLDCPSPRRLLAGSAEVDLDDLDDVAAGLLDVIRTVADRPIQGLQLRCDGSAGPDEDESDSWSSLLGAAGHYGWVTAIRLDGVTEVDQLEAELPGDLLLVPRVAAGRVPDDRRHGGGLPAEAWADTSEAARIVTEAAGRGFRFGEIPAEASPEVVVARVTALASP